MEQGEGMPDIMLLPSIAAYYGKTVDELLGCSEIEKAQKIDGYMLTYNANLNAGKIQENIELMKTVLREFPATCAFIKLMPFVVFCRQAGISKGMYSSRRKGFRNKHG